MKKRHGRNNIVKSLKYCIKISKRIYGCVCLAEFRHTMNVCWFEVAKPYKQPDVQQRHRWDTQVHQKT